MDIYYNIITFMDLFLLLFMSILVGLSEALNRKQKKGLLCAFLLIALMSLLDYIALQMNTMSSHYWIYNLIARYLVYALSPIVPIFIVQAADRRRRIRIPLLIALGYMVFLAASIPWGIVFYVNEYNRFFQGRYFYLMVLANASSIIYLMYCTISMARRYQSRGKFLIYPIILFVLVGIWTKYAFPEVNVYWMVITMLAILFYVFCNEMWQQLDGLTELLNQKSYLNRTASIRREVLLIVFDVDDFKTVNDRYGHLSGDLVLIDIADCIRQAYADFGYCYRIGGDEFCVLLEVPGIQYPCYANFLKALEAKRKVRPILPFVSIGTAVFAGGDNILAAKERADRELYTYKKKHKEDRANGKYDDGSIYASSKHF